MKILFLQLGKIGDMTLASSAFAAIKEKYPRAEIHVIASRSNYLIAVNHKYVAKTFIYKKKPIEIVNLIYKLKREKYDYYIDPKDHRSTESRIFAKLIKAEIKIGFNPEGEKQIFDISVPGQDDNINSHYVSQVFKALVPLGIRPALDSKPLLFESIDSERYVEDFIRNEVSSRFIVINISATTENRMWQIDKWIEVIKTLETCEFKVLINAAPKHIDIAKEIAKSSEKAMIFPSRNIMDAVSIIARAWFIISPDTAAIHIAGAFNTPTIALYGSNPAPMIKFKPLSDISYLLSPESGEYISGIPSSEVIDSVNSLLERL